MGSEMCIRDRTNRPAKKNFWQKRTVSGAGEEYLCRWGHVAGLVNQQTVFVFGGINDEGYAVRSVYNYDFVENEIYDLTENGTPIPTRIGCGLLPIGNGMLMLYGGEDPQGRGSFSDLWHIKVHPGTRDVHYKEAKYKEDHEHYIMGWR